MKLLLKFNTAEPDSNGNIFGEQVIDAIIESAENVPVFLEYDSSPIGFVTAAERCGSEIELEAKLDEKRPETFFFEKEFIVYSVTCSYSNMSFEQTGNVRIIKSARLSSVIIEPGRKFPPMKSRIF